jgi:hypothetical protein
MNPRRDRWKGNRMHTSTKPVLPQEHLEVPHKILRKLVAKEQLE